MEVSRAMQPGKHNILEATALGGTYVIITSQDVPGLSSKTWLACKANIFETGDGCDGLGPPERSLMKDEA
jgi:hypothetical protein